MVLSLHEWGHVVLLFDHRYRHCASESIEDETVFAAGQLHKTYLLQWVAE